MYFLPIVVIFCYASSFTVSRGSSVETVSANASVSCESYQTPCTFGCCVFAEGVCCADGFECCQHGQICIPFIGVCLGLKDSSNDLSSLVSTKSTPVKNSIAACPPGTTTCGPDRCCSFPHATCCSDGIHCCPHGYRCDLIHLQCVRDSYNDLNKPWKVQEGATRVSLQKSVPKSPHKSCPGDGRICPSYMSCCIVDDGGWGCCPNPSLPQIRYGDGECCDAIFGFICCPDKAPTCTVYGCKAF